MSSDRPRGGRSAREELLNRGRARTHRERAAEFLTLARGADEISVKNRYLTIARHYCDLADAEEKNAARYAAERGLERNDT